MFIPFEHSTPDNSPHHQFSCLADFLNNTNENDDNKSLQIEPETSGIIVHLGELNDFSFDKKTNIQSFFNHLIEMSYDISVPPPWMAI